MLEKPVRGDEEFLPRRLPRVLLTAFRPFAGRPVNGSETVVSALLEEPHYASIMSLNLPVHWEVGLEHLPAAIESWQPDLLLCFGEGSPGLIAVETYAYNNREGLDEREQAPSSAWIITSGPERLVTRLKYRWNPQLETRWPLSFSHDPGAYLCNELFYYALLTEVPRVGFVHLPPQLEMPGPVYARGILPFVQDLIRQNMAHEAESAAPRWH